MTDDDVPDGLLELAARVDEGRTIDWDAEERAAADDAARAVIRGFRTLAGVAAVARSGEAGLDDAASMTTGADGALSRTRWGQLRLEEPVGRGAFSEVYRAIDPLGREVAVKLLTPRLAEDDLRARVLAEGRLLASVKHPNIVVVHSVDEHDGRVGLWMEFVRGRTIADEVGARGVFSADEAVVIGRALCGALAAVHAKGLIHGDVKAHNVMREDGGRVVLMDFGAGRSIEDSSGGIDVLAGTPLYLCPERLRGGPASAATDIYSLGVLLYHLVTGRHPVEGDTRADVDAAHRSGRRTRLRDRRPDLPDPFVAAVERALAPDPTARFASAGAFEQALTTAATPTAPFRPLGGALPSVPVPRSRRRWPLRLGLGGVAALAAATIVALSLLPRGGTAPPAGPSHPASSPAAPTSSYTVHAAFRRLAGQTLGEPLTAADTVRVGTAFALQVQASRPVHVYVISEDGQREPTVLFPTPDGPVFNPIPADLLQTLPQPGGGWQVDGAAARESLFVITSPTPLPEYEAAMAPLPRAGDGETPEALLTTRSVRTRIRPEASWPWHRAARPLTSGAESIDGTWVRQLTLQHIR